MKQRLLGAAVLIALAVIFVPMFFGGTPPKAENSTVGLNIPPAPERNFETRNLAVDNSAAKTPTPVPQTTTSASNPPAPSNNDKVTSVDTGAPSSFEAPDSSTAPAPSAPIATATKPAPTPTAAPAPPPAPPPPVANAQSDGRFAVNLGIYAESGRASALVDRIKKLGYPAFAEATEYQGKSAQRVRVGPYANRAAAESVRLKIKQAEDKVPSSVVDVGERSAPASLADKPPAPAAKAISAPIASTSANAPALPANRAGGYTVQVAALKSEDEANKLRDRLRGGGVAAFVEKNGAEPPLWKVRAGPYVDRGGADAAQASIKQKFQLNGMVTTQP